MLSFEKASKSFGSQILFDNISFRINKGDRVGLVGRNGHGKTTLFRIIAGHEQVAAGALSRPKNYRVSYVRQRIDFSKESVIEECMTGLSEDEKDHEWKAAKILSGLGFAENGTDRNPHEFSGGFQVRLNLAKAIMSDPDMLLLDEPTNYLDIASIRWIVRFLRGWPRELMLITHDRNFMDRVATHIVGIHRAKVRKIKGDTGKYYSSLAAEEEIYEKTRVNDEKRRKEIQQFISRFRAKARLASLVQSRVKTLNRMEKKKRLEHIKDLEFKFLAEPFRKRRIGSVTNLSFAYDKKSPLFSDLSFTLWLDAWL